MISRTFYPLAIIPIGILYSVMTVTGLVPFAGTIAGWASIVCFSVALYVFLEPIHKIWFLFFSAYIGSLFGRMDFFALLGGWCLAAFAIECIFFFMIKHHTPWADSILIALGAWVLILASVGIQKILSVYGFSDAFVSGRALWEAMTASVPLVLSMVIILVIISNYSKYGSIFKI